MIIGFITAFIGGALLIKLIGYERARTILLGITLLLVIALLVAIIINGD